MEFLNPNVAGHMAQLLQHNQEKYVPVMVSERNSTSTVLACIPLHGDQLFEERARNVKWTFRDGLDPVERIDGIDTEFTDWHVKYTLYKVRCQTDITISKCQHKILNCLISALLNNY